MDRLNEIAITVDQDWVPDFMSDALLKWLTIRNIKSTWFITHDSPILLELKKSPFVELGIHPNFLQGSTQGKNSAEVMKGLLRIVPDAKAARTHAMVYSASVARLLAVYGMQVDSSVYLGGMEGINPFRTKYTSGESIWRMPYFWSDDAELSKPCPEWQIWDENGLKVLCFHPVHCYLNTAKWSDYLEFRQHDQKDIKQTFARLFVNDHEFGVADFLEKLLSHNVQSQYRTLSEIANGIV
jgi:hypothetical protein